MMTVASLRQANESDFDAILRLNDAEVQHTSPMDLERLRHLDDISCFHKVASVDGTVAAFLLAMRHDAPYVNDNFSWFTARYSAFVYVDRIVVSAGFGRNKLGSLLYTDLFAFARINGVPLVTCEYNVIPANEPSRRFHDKFGFKEIGTQWVSNRTKLVSLQAAEA
jgi:predicted GNAT superfamily acetyltransferase